MSEQLIQFWDIEIRKWMENRLDQPHPFGMPFRQNAFDEKRGDYRFCCDALPEPYVGNPIARNKVVMLNMNPGPTNNAQLRGGPLVAAVEARSYSSVFRSWGEEIPQATVSWWKKRARWLKRICRLEDPDDILYRQCCGLDMIPWHSTKTKSDPLLPLVGEGGIRGELRKQSIEWIKTRVLQPARAIAKQSDFKTGPAENPLGLPKDVPIIVAVGTVYCRLYEKFGWDSILSEFVLDNRSFSLFLFDDVIVFQTHSTRGRGNPLPGSSYDDLIRLLLGLP